MGSWGMKHRTVTVEWKFTLYCKNWIFRSHMNLSPGCWDFSVPRKSGTKVPTSIAKFGEWRKTLEWIGWVSNMDWICWTYTDQETVISDGLSHHAPLKTTWAAGWSHPNAWWWTVKGISPKIAWKNRFRNCSRICTDKGCKLFKTC